jgi:hypothetical protein
MIMRLPTQWEEFLTGQPESGMGYQRVDVRLASGRLVEDVPVFNADEIQLPDDCEEPDIRDLWLHRHRP